MDSRNGSAVQEKQLWKKIKRNGSFHRQKKELLRTIVQPVIDTKVSESGTDPTIVLKNVSSPDEPNTLNLSETETPTLCIQETHNEENRSDDEPDDYYSTSDPQELCDDLKNWAIVHQVKHTAINALMNILRSHIPQNNLPKDARTLVQTPRATEIVSDERLGGQYWHNGLTTVLTKVLSTFSEIPPELSLNVNIDGLPTFKSSSSAFWPILVNIHELRTQHSPLVVGIFCGQNKPKDVNAFLEPFVYELNKVLQNGITINGRNHEFKLRCFICDTPARSMLRGVIGHNGYGSCLKCTTEGEYSHEFRTMIFPQINAPLRTDADFRSRIYEGHHKSDSLLEQIHGIDMVNDFPIGDALHLIDLGITKRFLNGWKCGTLNNLNAKWSARQIDNVSTFLEGCKLPREIRRPARSLDHLARWKGTEFRSFLLYLSPVILKNFFESDEIIDHFLNFYCAIQICSRNDQPSENYAVARNLINDFLEGVKVLYGLHLFSSNMHNLVHLIDDVERFGPLNSFDAYPFESKLYVLKKLIRSGNLPLSQVARRIIEIQSNISSQNNLGSDKPSLKKKCTIPEDSDSALRKFLQNNECDVYSFINLENFCVDTGSDSDRWVLTPTCEVIAVKYIIHNSIKNTIHFYGNPVLDLMDFFIKPIVSSSLFIYGSNLNLKPPQFYELNLIRCKMVKIDCKNSRLPKSVFIPLIHTIK